jgi:transposase InsO family protein
MAKNKSEEIALFRYGIIAPVIHNQGVGQMKYFRKLSSKELDVPHLGKKRYEVATFKSWLHRYRKTGFEGLYPQTRSDKGVAKKIGDDLAEAIKEKLSDYPSLSASGIYRMLVSEGMINTRDLCEGTLRKYIRDNNLRTVKATDKARKKYEKAHINELWMADAMHGPYLLDGNRKHKAILISIIDDCSRVIVGAKFFFSENSINLEKVLKEAILKFGLPKVFYCDNGSIFISSNLQLACARLGIALVHSIPYDSSSRGKIERYHRTVREKFLVCMNISDTTHIDELNACFSSWLNKEYHRGYHFGIEDKPLDKWMNDLNKTEVRRVSAQELDLAFYMTIERKVKNDSTISIKKVLYEVPYNFIGERIEIRYPIDNPDDLTLYKDNKPVYKLKKVNPIENANLPSWEIRFKKGGK